MSKNVESARESLVMSELIQENPFLSGCSCHLYFTATLTGLIFAAFTRDLPFHEAN